MIEVEVHSYLRDFLRENGDRNFPHHLTMARLIARALRLGRSALMQTGSSVGKYCLSYLMPILLGDWSVIIVAPPTTQQYLLEEEIPQLQSWLGTNKQVRMGDRWQQQDRLLLTSPESWLSDRLVTQAVFPTNIPTIIEHADNLEEWTRELLTISIDASDWQELLRAIPKHGELIRNTRVKLTKSIFARPENPYGNYVLLNSELDLITRLCEVLAQEQLLQGKFKQFWDACSQRATISWIARDRQLGVFTINLAPAEIKTKLQPVWRQQPVVILGGFLDIESDANIYRQQLGLDPEMLSLKFSPNRQNSHIQLYIPDRFPLPNTPDFQSASIEQTLLLVSLSSSTKKLIVVIVDDVPLQGQVGSALAAEFGSRVRVEKTTVNDNGILICGWSFWQQFQETLPTPQLVIIVTLPIPSLENPLVANRVAYYKSRGQDWFRMYLLPTALKTLEQTIVPLRESQSIIALLDNRVNSRSYGRAILSTLEPCARINYIDPTWFGYLDS
ncbi:MAG: helicase C-terminal domain-containing protein [Pleurocapsa sp. MO_226.B13]|nr:helicase C-terminal domain-containing protein [Pleurocapsa sp. MO_226.B13]